MDVVLCLLAGLVVVALVVWVYLRHVHSPDDAGATGATLTLGEPDDESDPDQP